MYSTCPGDAAAAGALGFAVRPGHMLALALQACHAPTVRGWGQMPWHVQSGDRM